MLVGSFLWNSTQGTFSTFKHLPTKVATGSGSHKGSAFSGGFDLWVSFPSPKSSILFLWCLSSSVPRTSILLSMWKGKTTQSPVVPNPYCLVGLLMAARRVSRLFDVEGLYTGRTGTFWSQPSSESSTKPILAISGPSDTCVIFLLTLLLCFKTTILCLSPVWLPAPPKVCVYLTPLCN